MSERIEEYTYVGLIVRADSDHKKEIRRGIEMRLSTSAKHDGILSRSLVQYNLPGIMFGLETWCFADNLGI